MIKIRIHLLLLIACFSGTVFNKNFETLSEIKQFSQAYPDAPKSDNEDWIDPEFTSWYKKWTPTYFGSLLESFGLVSAPPRWCPHEFKVLIDRVIQDREARDLKSPYDKDLSLKAGDRCVIWGDLHGAFHSMTRDLLELNKMGILSEDLKITQENVQFIIIGDALSRSPYSIELLTLILQLMDKNPEQVTYVRGNHEKRAYWENFSTRRILRRRAQQVAVPEDKEIPLSSVINRLFETMPDAIAVSNAEDPDKVIAYCAHDSVGKKKLGEGHVYAQIFGEKRITVSEKVKPLEFLGFTYGVSYWSLISCPTRVYRDYFNFYYDSFAMLELGDSIKTSILSLYSRDVRKDKGFTRKDYDLIFGTRLQNREDVFKDGRINPYLFGSTLALSGGLKSLGKGVNRGVQVAIHELNRENGVNGRLVKPLMFDDRYVPRYARANINHLHDEYNVDTVLIPVGSPTLGSYIDRVKKDTAVLFPYTGGPQFRKPELQNIVHLRASYEDEARVLIDYFMTVYGIKRFAFFYQNDGYGTPPMKAAVAQLKKYGITEVTLLPYAREQTDFTDLADRVRAENPEAIGCFSASSPTQELISQLGPNFFLGRPLFGISFLENATFTRFLGERGINLVYSSVVPDAEKSDLKIVQEYRTAMDRHGHSYESNSLEGYVAARLLVDALKHLKAPYTKDKIVQYFSGLQNYNFGGLNLTFRPESRGFVLPVWIRAVDGEWIEYKIKS